MKGTWIIKYDDGDGDPSSFHKSVKGTSIITYDNDDDLFLSQICEINFDRKIR